MPKKAKTPKKSVTWKDTEEAGLRKPSKERSASSENKPRPASVAFKIYTLPFHYLAVIYYLLYVEYDDLIKFETIDTVLLKALPLTYFGQLAWLTVISISSGKKKGLDLGISLILAATFVSLLSSLAIYVVAVLLGSPILAFQSQTLLFSLHMSLLVTFPLVVVYQFNLGSWRALITEITDLEFLASSPFFVTALLNALGGWAGVLTIPLDWDRDWQIYPVSLMVGAYGIGFVGSVVATILPYVAKLVSSS